MLRCVLFIILLAVNFISDIYLFITLMITEVIMMFLVQLEFNKKFFTSIVTGATSVMPSGANLSSTQTLTGTSRSTAVEQNSSSQNSSSA
jgi:hypothetical protein